MALNGMTETEREMLRIYQDPKLPREQKIRMIDALSAPERSSAGRATAENDPFLKDDPFGQSGAPSVMPPQSEPSRADIYGSVESVPRTPGNTPMTDAQLAIFRASGVGPPKTAEDELAAIASKAPPGQTFTTPGPARTPDAPTDGSIDLSKLARPSAAGGGAEDPYASLASAMQPRYAQVGSDTFVPRQRTVTPGLKVDESEQALIESTYREEKGAKVDRAEADQYAREAGRRADLQAEAQIAEQERQAQEQEEARRQQVEKRMGDWETAMNEWVQERVQDPQGPGDKIMSTIGIALGALGGGAEGMSAINKMVQDRIKNNIDIQLANIQKGKAGVEMKAGLLAKTQELLGDERQVKAAMRAAEYQRIARQLERFKDFTQDPARKADSDLQIAHWEREALGEKINLRKAMEDQTQTVEVFDPKRTVQVGGGLKGATKSREELNAWLKAHGLDPSLYIPGANGYATNEKTAQDLRKKFSGASELRGYLSEMLTLAQKGKTGKLGGSDMSRMKVLWNKAALASKTVEELGVIAGPDMDILKSAIPDAGEIVNFGDAQTGLETAIRAYDSGVTKSQQQHGIIEGPPPIGMRAGPERVPEVE